MATRKINKKPDEPRPILIAEQLTKGLLQAYKDNTGLMGWFAGMPSKYLYYLARPREIMPWNPLEIQFTDHKYRIATLALLIEKGDDTVDVWDEKSVIVVKKLGSDNIRNALNVLEIFAALEILHREKIINIKKRTKWGLVLTENSVRDGLAYQKGENFDRGEEIIKQYPENIHFELHNEWFTIGRMFENPEEAHRFSFDSF